MKSAHIKSGAQTAAEFSSSRVLSCLVVFGFAVLATACSHNPFTVDTAAVEVKKPVKDFAAAEVKQPAKQPAVQRVASIQPKVTPEKTREITVHLKTVTETAAYGRGPYICSPSGFGQMSRCVPRVAYN